MYRTIELIYDTLGTKREQLRTANEKRESHIRSLLSQQNAIDSLSRDIEILESELKNLHSMNVPGKMAAMDNGCSLSASPGTMSKPQC